MIVFQPLCFKHKSNSYIKDILTAHKIIIPCTYIYEYQFMDQKNFLKFVIF